jgi:hypothetical protein
MKTAMQELIDEMDIIKGQLWQEGLKDKSTMISDMIKKAVDKLEKEKEQLCNAYTDGLEGPYIGAEEYYNQTYNQKIPELLYKDGTPMRKVKLSKEAQELLDEATKRFNQPNLCCTR